MATSSGISTPKTSSKPSQLNQVSKVRVVVRVRPFLPSEILEKSGNPISCASVLNPEWGSGDVAVYLKDQETSRKECYKLDSFYGQDSSVTQIFQKEVTPLIPEIFHGSNATIFAYGATGSGKTHTMQGSDELPGLMPLAMSTILSMCESSNSFAEISYYEVYMDRCYDLLAPKANEISVLDDKDGQVQLRGLSRVPVSSMSEFHQAFSCGIQRRKVAHTGLNDVSSRSHGVLVISVSTPAGDGSMPVVIGKLNLIDLAGNEDNRRTGNEGIRLQESAKINQSLFALSNVIYALNNNKPRVPYRESKLTRILQDSLGGNSHALMVACLNPGEYQESLNTVSLASRSRQITNLVSSAQKEETPKVTIDMEAKLRAWLESKGKTKSTQRMGTLGSPVMTKTPFSTKSIKKQSSCQTSTKTKTTTEQDLVYNEARNLFNSGTRVLNSKEESYSSNASTMCTEFVSNQDVSHSVKEYKDWFDIPHEDASKISEEDENCEFQQVAAPCGENHFNSQDNDLHNHFMSQDHGANFIGVDPPCKQDQFNSHNTNCYREAEALKEKNITTSMTNILQSTTSFCDESLNNDKTCNPSNSSVESPPINEKLRALQKSLRKVLSPINSNANARIFENPSSKDQICLVFLEPNTPETPYVLACDSEGLQRTKNPLDKFNSQSSNFKSSLVQEYLAVLNSASKEELLRLKGIGHKRAESILELRETTPLKSLYDLEKIGLSSKQVNDMFRKAAKGIFD